VEQLAAQPAGCGINYQEKNYMANRLCQRRNYPLTHIPVRLFLDTELAQITFANPLADHVDDIES
jgi:hypothetical protein